MHYLWELAAYTGSFEVELTTQFHCAMEQYWKRTIDKQNHTIVISKKGYLFLGIRQILIISYQSLQP